MEELYEIYCPECNNVWVGNPYTDDECPNCGEKGIVLREIK